MRSGRGSLCALWYGLSLCSFTVETGVSSIVWFLESVGSLKESLLEAIFIIYRSLIEDLSGPNPSQM